MSTNITEKPIQKDWEKIIEIDGHEITAVVSPCSWMYHGYGLQLTIDLDVGGRTYPVLKAKPFETATESDADELLKGVHLAECACPGCKGVQFVDPTSNREGKCEKCFLGELNNEYEAAKAKADAEEAVIDKEKYEQGFRYKVIAWIHPERGGDDYSMALYCTIKPTKAAIKKELKKLGSSVLDDFQMEEMKVPEPEAVKISSPGPRMAP